MQQRSCSRSNSFSASRITIKPAITLSARGSIMSSRRRRFAQPRHCFVWCLSLRLFSWARSGRPRAHSSILPITNRARPSRDRRTPRRISRIRRLPRPGGARKIPDPQGEEAFLQSKLRWEEIGEGRHAATLRLYREFLQLRRQSAVLRDRSRDNFQVLEPSDGIVRLLFGKSGSEQCLILADLAGGHRLHQNSTERMQLAAAPFDNERAFWRRRCRCRSRNLKCAFFARCSQFVRQGRLPGLTNYRIDRRVDATRI